MIKCFEPWIDQKTKAVVIGTMPSVKSLENEMYYAHPQNNFWRFMAEILNNGQAIKNRKTFLLSHHVGLWDSLQSCEREGSLDSNITDMIYNDFHKYPQIRYFLFNGQKAFRFFKMRNADLLNESNYFVLPSTSPANASLSRNEKLQIWREVFLKILSSF